MHYFQFLTADNKKMRSLYASEADSLDMAVRLTNLTRALIALLTATIGVYLLPGSLILDTGAKLFAIPLIVTTIIMLIAACYFFETGRDQIGRGVLTADISVVSVVTVIFCGGFSSSLFTSILIFPMALGFAVLPKKFARINALLVIAVPLVVDLFVNLTGITLPDYTSASYGPVTQISLMVILFTAVYFCLSHLKHES